MRILELAKDKMDRVINAITSKNTSNAVDNYYGKPILGDTEGNDLISRLMNSPEPVMIARLGRIEIACLLNYLERKANKKIPYKKSVRQSISINAGFFPPTDDMLDRFCNEFLNHLRRVDVLAVWFIPKEDYFAHEYCKNARLVLNRSLEPYYHQRPWTSSLRDRKVLVIHPYESSIVSQFQNNRARLFADPGVLPPFQLETIKAVQSVVGNRTPFENWFEAYRSMCSEMEKKDFDVAIIGAGAYGLPLASHAKMMGKKAIQMGGATQILFGIKGKRWDDHEIISKLYNGYWVRPSHDETPDNYRAVEGGCYW